MMDVELEDMTIREAHAHLAKDGLRLCGRCSAHRSMFRRYLCTGCMSELARLKYERLRKEGSMPRGGVSSLYALMVRD